LAKVEDKMNVKVSAKAMTGDIGGDAGRAAPGAIDAAVGGQVLRSIAARREATDPYRHWHLFDVLPDEICAALVDLPFAAPRIADTKGKRETHNGIRTFFSIANRTEFAVCNEVAAAFQSEPVARALEDAFAIALKGSFLRIEYCQDTGGFWLEPHRDVDVKLITMQVYLSAGPDAESLGTDIYRDENTWFGAVQARFSSALVFVPGENTWHGFRRRQFAGIRRSIIINYVTPSWRARHELAYPTEPVF
jgi:hypothetical protein